jgi:hypothetical protein
MEQPRDYVFRMGPSPDLLLGGGSTEATMNPSEAKVTLDVATRIVYVEAALADGDVFNNLEEVPEPERGDFTLCAFKVGVLALRDARTVAKVDFVEKEFARMRTEFRGQIKETFGPEGQVTKKIEEVFGENGAVDAKMRTFFGEGGRFQTLLEEYCGEDGKLCRSLDTRIGPDGDFHNTLDEFLGQEGALRQALEGEFGPDAGRLYRILNPDDEKTPLGRLRKTLDHRFDPAREGSFIYELRNYLTDQFTTQIAKLRQDLGLQAAVAAERAKGSQKGIDFQDHVFTLVNRLAAPHGDRVEDTSMIKGALGVGVGDAVVSLDPEFAGGLDRRIVLEAKNGSVTRSGKTSILSELDEAMRNRDAHFAIAAVEHSFADAFAPLRYVAPDKVLVAVDAEETDSLPLQVAYQLARAFVVARAVRREAELDVEAILGRLTDINRHLETVRAMKMNLKGAVTNIDNVKRTLDQMKESIEDTVKDLVRAVQKVRG